MLQLVTIDRRIVNSLVSVYIHIYYICMCVCVCMEQHREHVALPLKCEFCDVTRNGTIAGGLGKHGEYHTIHTMGGGGGRGKQFLLARGVDLDDAAAAMQMSF